MRKKILKPGILTLLITITTTGYAQEYRLGGSAIYNFANQGIGLGARVEFPVKRIELLDGLSIVPQVAYFPSFNKNTEFYFGSSVHLGIYSIYKWSFYAWEMSPINNGSTTRIPMTQQPNSPICQLKEGWA